MSGAKIAQTALDKEGLAQPEQEGTEKQFEQALKERDRYHQIADDLAAQIEAMTGEEIGEHSSANNPWHNAMIAADEFIAKQVPEPDQQPAECLDCGSKAVGIPSDDVPGGETAKPQPEQEPVADTGSHIAHTLAGFRGAFVSLHGRPPTEQEIWNHAIRWWRYLNPAPPLPVQEPVADEQPMYYFQDSRGFVGNCSIWWALNGSGYTTDLRKAQKYTLAQAVRQNRFRESDLPWLCSEIDALQRPTVDHQDMAKLRSNEEQRAAIQAAHNMRAKP